MSSAEGRINSSPTVKGLALAIGLATKNDVFCSDTFNEVVAFNNCFCSLVHFFFLLKNSKSLSFNTGSWSPCGKAVLKASWLCWIASCPYYTTWSWESVSHLLQWTCKLTMLGRLVAVVWLLRCVWLFCGPMDCSPPGSSVHGVSQVILEWVAISFSRGSSQTRTLEIFFQMLFFGAVLVFCCLTTGSFLPYRKALQGHLFLHILARVSLWAYQNCNWVQLGKEAQTEVKW